MAASDFLNLDGKREAVWGLIGDPQDVFLDLMQDVFEVRVR